MIEKNKWLESREMRLLDTISKLSGVIVEMDRDLQETVKMVNVLSETRDNALEEAWKLEQDLNIAKAKITPWYRKPILWAIIGAIGGGYLVNQIK